MIAVLLLGGFSNSAAAQAVAQTPTAEAAQLVKRLGSAVNAERNAAMAELIGLQAGANAALLEGVRDTDPEIRRRSRQALAQVIQLELKQQIADFEATKPGVALPGWKRFADRFGTSVNVRKTFAAMMNVEPGAMLAYGIDDEAAADAVSARVRQYLASQNSPNPNRRKVPDAMNLLALLMIATEPSISSDLNVVEQSQFRNWWHQQEFRKLVNDAGPHQTVAKGVQLNYLRMGFAADQLRFASFNDALQFRVVECLPEAIKYLHAKPSGYAVECVARLGGKAYVEALLPCLEDDSTVTNFFINGKVEAIQSRDLALAWIVNFTGQKPADYDLPHATAWFQQIAQNPQNGINFGAYRFNNVEKRAEMIGKLKASLAKRPIAPMPVPTPEEREGFRAVPGGPAKDPAEAETPDDEQPIGLNLAEGFEVQKLNRARQLIREQRFAEAAAHLGELIRRVQDRWYQPVRGTPQYLELRTEAERLVRELPEIGLAVYEQHFGPAARKLLDQAMETNDLALLEKLSKESFHTQAGAEASYRLANFDFDIGHLMDAAMRFERLAQQSHWASNFEPNLSLKRAMCWSRLGDGDQARRVLANLKADHSDVAVTLGGRVTRLFEKPETVGDWLALVAPQTVSADDWLLHRGRADRNPQTKGVQPVLFATSTSTLLTAPPLKDPLSDAKAWVKKYRLSRIPTVQPLVLGDVIFFRTLTDLRAVNSRGDVLWTAEPEDTINGLLHRAIGVGIESQGPFVTEFLQERLFDDSTYGTLASDGRSVFCIESDRFEPSPEVQRLAVDAEGRLTLSTDSQDGTNALSAYDVVTGKLKWQKRSTGSKASLKYLGPPLVIGGNLFVIVSRKEETTLRELDAATGDMRRQWLLNSSQFGPTLPIWWTRARPKQLESPFASSPSYANGVVICRTPNQRIVAIDLTTGALRWAFQVPRIEAPSVNPFNPWQRTSREVNRVFELDRWCDTSLLIQGDAVLVTAPDSNELVCLALSDGHVRWTAPRGDGVFVAAVDAGRVLIAGRNGMRAVQLADGTPAWPVEVRDWPNAAMPAGLGYLTNGTYFMPLTSGDVVGIEVESGRFVTRSHKLEDWVPGNLVVAAGRVFSLGWDGLRSLQSGNERIATLAEVVRSQPQNAALMTELGAAYFAAGRVTEGLEQLRVAEALEASAQSRAHLILRKALTDSTSIPPELRKSLMSEAFLKRLPDDTSGQLLRWDLHVELARAFERNDDLPAAVNELLSIAGIPLEAARLSDSNQLQRLSVARSVRLDAWYQAQLATWLDRLNPEQRATAATRLAELVNGEQPIERRLALFGGLPEGRRLQTNLVDQLIGKGQSFEAELLLRRIYSTTTPTGERELLFKLRSVWEPKPAVSLTRRAAWLSRLESVHADELFSNGQRGREVGQSEPQNSTVRAALNAPSPWEVVRPKKSEKPLNPAPTTIEPRVMAEVHQSVDADPRLWLGFDQTKRNWYGLDKQGNRLWELSGQKSFYQSYSGSGTPFARAVGPLLVVWTGSALHAIDTSTPEAKQLWTTPTIENSNDWRTQIAIRRMQRNQIVVGNRMPRPEIVWQPFALQPSYVAIQKLRDLLCLEPLTGNVIWKRDDAPAESDLIGNEQFLCAIESDGNRGFVYRASDGQDAGIRQLPPRERWVGWSGTKLITRQETETDDVLSCRDVIADQEIWSRRVARGTKSHAMSDQSFAVLDPGGRLELIETTTGRKLTEARVPAPTKLEGLFVTEAFDRLLVFVDEPLAAAPQFGFVRTTQHQINVNGRCHAVNRSDGTVAWSLAVENDSMSSFNLPELPLLGLGRSTQKVELDANGQVKSTIYESRLRVLNVRTGDIELEDVVPNIRLVEVLHDASQKMARAKMNQLREFSFEPPTSN